MWKDVGDIVSHTLPPPDRCSNLAWQRLQGCARPRKEGTIKDSRLIGVSNLQNVWILNVTLPYSKNDMLFSGSWFWYISWGTLSSHTKIDFLDWSWCLDGSFQKYRPFSVIPQVGDVGPALSDSRSHGCSAIDSRELSPPCKQHHAAKNMTAAPTSRVESTLKSALIRPPSRGTLHTCRGMASCRDMKAFGVLAEGGATNFHQACQIWLGKGWYSDSQKQQKLQTCCTSAPFLLAWVKASPSFFKIWTSPRPSPRAILRVGQGGG